MRNDKRRNKTKTEVKQKTIAPMLPVRACVLIMCRFLWREEEEAEEEEEEGERDSWEILSQVPAPSAREEEEGEEGKQQESSGRFFFHRPGKSFRLIFKILIFYDWFLHPF